MPGKLQIGKLHLVKNLCKAAMSFLGPVGIAGHFLLDMADDAMEQSSQESSERELKEESMICCYNFSDELVALPEDLILHGYSIIKSNVPSNEASLKPWEGRIYSNS